jgi:hypothetical protein
MAEKTHSPQKHGTGTAEHEQGNKSGQQPKDQGKTGEQSGSNPQNQHNQPKHDQSKGTPHNK